MLFFPFNKLDVLLLLLFDIFKEYSLEKELQSDIPLAFFKLPFEISGKFIIFEHPLKIEWICFILLVFHFEILGNFINEEQFSNILFILVILLISHFDISGSLSKEEHP